MRVELQSSICADIKWYLIILLDDTLVSRKNTVYLDQDPEAAISVGSKVWSKQEHKFVRLGVFVERTAPANERAKRHMSARTHTQRLLKEMQ